MKILQYTIVAMGTLFLFSCTAVEHAFGVDTCHQLNGHRTGS